MHARSGLHAGALSAGLVQAVHASSRLLARTLSAGLVRAVHAHSRQPIHSISEGLVRAVHALHARRRTGGILALTPLRLRVHSKEPEAEERSSVVGAPSVLTPPELTPDLADRADKGPGPLRQPALPRKLRGGRLAGGPPNVGNELFDPGVKRPAGLHITQAVNGGVLKVTEQTLEVGNASGNT